MLLGWYLGPQALCVSTSELLISVEVFLTPQMLPVSCPLVTKGTWQMGPEEQVRVPDFHQDSAFH